MAELRETLVKLTKLRNHILRARIAQALIWMSTMNGALFYIFYLSRAEIDAFGGGSRIVVSQIEMIWITFFVSFFYIFTIILTLWKFDQHKCYHQLDQSAKDQGLITQQQCGVLSALATLLPPPHPIWLKPLKSKNLTQNMGAEHDLQIFTLIARRAQVQLNSAPKLVPRPSWELGGVLLIGGLWMCSQVSFEISVTHEVATEDSLLVVSSQKNKFQPESKQTLQTKNQRVVKSKSDHPRLDTTSQTQQELNAASPTSFLAKTSKQPHPSVSTVSKSPHSSSYQDTSLKSKRIKERRTQQRRAQQGGRVSRAEVNSASRTHHIKLEPHSDDLAEELIKKAHDEKTHHNTNKSSVSSYQSVLSVAESADKYGVSSKLSRFDFPPHLRVYLENSQEKNQPDPN